VPPVPTAAPAGSVPGGKGGDLPFTGAGGTIPLIAAALCLVLLGAAALLIGRRQRR
jgi:LPXTG-motif cell wall-anchored protein